MAKISGYLSEKLPEHMVPSAIMMVETLPLTANGKIDRRALPAPDRSALEPKTPYIAPRTQTEELLAAMFSQALGIETVGVLDNFFNSGGHSLTAVRIMAQMCDAFKIDLPLSAIFESPTIAALGERIDAITWLAKDVKMSANVGGGHREEAEL